MQFGLPLAVRWPGLVLVAWALAWSFGLRFEFRFSLVARWSGFGLVAWASAWNSVSFGGALAGPWLGCLGPGPVAWASVWNSFFPRRRVGRALGWLVSLGLRFVIRFALGGALAGPLDRLLGPGLGPLDFGLKSGLLLVALGAGLWIGSLGLGLVAWASVRNLVCPWWRFSRAWGLVAWAWASFRNWVGSRWRFGRALVWSFGPWLGC